MMVARASFWREIKKELNAQSAVDYPAAKAQPPGLIMAILPQRMPARCYNVGKKFPFPS